eukprot:c27900_g1_i1 orf=3-173(-)
MRLAHTHFRDWILSFEVFQFKHIKALALSRQEDSISASFLHTCRTSCQLCYNPSTRA